MSTHDLLIALWTDVSPLVDARTVLALASACWFAGGVAALIAARRALRRMSVKIARLEQLANSTSMDVKTLLRAGSRYETGGRDLESALAILGERLDQIELRATSGAAYERAADLARMGLSPEQLMRSVGLTRGEAELLAHLNRADAAA